jgi:Adenosine deaminase
MSPQPNAFILSLPKAELHLHLEGSIDPATLLELKQHHGKSSTLLEVENLYRYDDFNGFLTAFKSVTTDLQTPEDYELITYRRRVPVAQTGFPRPLRGAGAWTPARRARFRRFAFVDIRRGTPIRSGSCAGGL